MTNWNGLLFDGYYSNIGSRNGGFSNIMTCVTSTSFQTLINRKVGKQFYPSRGLRQGDLLSPSLFILALDVLLQQVEMFDKANDDGSSNLAYRIYITWSSFCGWFFSLHSTPIITRFQNLLAEFAALSGQTINRDKSMITFGLSTPHTVQRTTRAMLGFHRSQGHEKYLGLPLITGQVTWQLFLDLTETLDNRLHAWYNNFLSTLDVLHSLVWCVRLCHPVVCQPTHSCSSSKKLHLKN